MISTPVFRKRLRALTLSILLASATTVDAKADQLLASVGDYAIQASDLEEAIQSSPYATQFVTLDEDQQAALRGDLLNRLVASRLFTLEAQRLGLEQDPAFKADVDEYRLALLYRAYMERLRSRIEVPADKLAELKAQFKDEPDALAAARSAYVGGQYQAMQAVAMAHLAKSRHLQYFSDRVDPKMAADTVLAQGDGFTVSAAELGAIGEDDKAALEDRVRERVTMKLAALAAEADGIQVGPEVGAYVEERLPAVLMERKRREWLADEKVLRDYFTAHPELSRVPERRHIGQIVLATRAEAEAVRERILKGESLFALAGELSVDPWGKSQNGDMGWLPAGTGMPEIEEVLKGLGDGVLSPVIESPKGFHLVMVVERKLGKQMYFDAVRDRVERELVAERMTPYVQELQTRYPVTWHLAAKGGAEAAK